MLSRLVVSRGSLKASWMPSHRTCRTQGHSVDLFFRDSRQPALQIIVGTVDPECATALADRAAQSLKSRGMDYGLGVMCPLHHPLQVELRQVPVTVPLGSYLAVNPLDPVLPRRGRMFSVISIGAFQPFLRECREALGIPKAAGAFDFEPGPRPCSPSIRRAVRDVSRLAASPANVREALWFPLVLYGAVWRVLAAMWRDHPSGLERRLREFHGHLTGEPRLQRVILHLQEHVGERLGLEGLARVAGTSRSTLQRLFRREFQCEPHEFVRRIRVEHAERLMLQSGSSVRSLGAIAKAVGFERVESLREAFRAVRGREVPGVPGTRLAK